MHQVNMKKVIIVILIIAIASTILFIFVTSFTTKKQPQSTPIQTMPPTPKPTVVAPTPLPTVTFRPGALKILSVDPPPDKLNHLSAVAKIIITFDQIIDSQTFKYSSNPPLEIETDFLADTVVFEPKTIWPLDTKITIAILYAKGDQGGVLATPYQIELLSPAPTGL